jgi:uncharacterized protein involved in tolerance to divalent cations
VNEEAIARGWAAAPCKKKKSVHKSCYIWSDHIRKEKGEKHFKKTLKYKQKHKAFKM